MKANSNYLALTIFISILIFILNSLRNIKLENNKDLILNENIEKVNYYSNDNDSCNRKFTLEEIIDDKVILANGVQLGGHVEIQDNVIIGGLSAVHQFVRIGEGSMVGGMSGVVSDVIPFGSVTGNRAKLSGLNLIGMRRSKISKDEIQNLRKLYKKLFKTKEQNFKERIKEIKIKSDNYNCTKKVLDFLNNDSSRSFCLP